VELRCGLSGGGAAARKRRGGVVRGKQGRVPPFYSPERSRGRGVEAVGGEVGGRPPLMAMSSVGRGYGEGKGREMTVIGGVNAAVSSRRSGGGGGARGWPDAAGEAGGRAGKRGEGGGRR
jgi:hypothetical protein